MVWIKEIGVEFFFVDSEYNVIFQVFQGEQVVSVEKVILIVLGGLFCMFDLEWMWQVILQQVLKYLNWDMGVCIFIDSVIMMNKGFEVIEVYYFFFVGLE